MSATATVVKTRGPAFVVRDGQETPLTQGMELQASDSVRTGLDAGCDFRFADGTDVQLGPMSLVRIDDFAYDPANAEDSSFVMHMMEGMVKTVSGEVVKLNPEGFSLTTPLGTAGIRGTTVLTQVFPTHVVFMVTDMGAGHAVEVNSVFGGQLLILKPDMGAEINLTGQDRVTLLNGMPESMREAMESFFESVLDEQRSSHDDYFLLMGDAGFLAAVGAENVSRGVGMLATDQAEVLIALLQDLGAETPEFFLQAPPDGPGGDDVTRVSYWGDANPNYLVPTQSEYGDNFQNISYDIYGYAGNDTIVGFNGQDTIYGGQGSQDYIYKVTAAITAGNLIVGGESSLTTVATPDNDVIVLRALGASTDDEAGWISQTSADYGATTMSGGQVVGTAETLADSGDGASGNTAISLYGSMSGGAIYGSAVTATNSRLGNSTITVNQGLDENGNLTGGDVSGNAVIYGDAQSMSGGTAGNDSIVVGSLGGNAAIYGDAAGGSYRAGNNTITVTGAMDGGAIYSGDGNDSVSVGIFDNGLIDLGNGNDNLTISAYNDGAVNMGAGNDSASIGVYDGGVINMGNGDDSLNIGSSSAATLYMDAASDTLTILGDAPGSLDIGSVAAGTSLNLSGASSAITDISIGTLSGALTLDATPASLSIDTLESSGDYNLILGGGTISLLTVKEHTGTGHPDIFNSTTVSVCDYTSGAGDNSLRIYTLGQAGTTSTISLNEGADKFIVSNLNAGTYNVSAADGHHTFSLGRQVMSASTTINLSAEAGSTLTLDTDPVSFSSTINRITTSGEGDISIYLDTSYVQCNAIRIGNTGGDCKIRTPVQGLTNSTISLAYGQDATATLNTTLMMGVRINDTDAAEGRGLFTCDFTTGANFSTCTLNLTKGQNILNVFSSNPMNRSTITLGNYDDQVVADLGAGSREVAINLGGGADSLRISSVGYSSMYPNQDITINLGNDADADTINLITTVWDSASTGNAVTWNITNVGVQDQVLLTGSIWSVDPDASDAAAFEYVLTDGAGGHTLTLQADADLNIIA